MKVLDTIRNTSLVRLRKIVSPNCGDVFVKLEWENPTGSMKDRMALAAISRAEEDGRLRPGDTVVEYSGGSTGASIALPAGCSPHRGDWDWTCSSALGADAGGRDPLGQHG
jgi:cysteine synthase A